MIQQLLVWLGVLAFCVLAWVLIGALGLALVDWLILR